MLKVIWNSVGSDHQASLARKVAINNKLKSRLSALLNDERNIRIPEEERKELTYKLHRLEWETEFIRRNRENYLSLTKREHEVMQLLLEGYNNPQIAKELYISRHTVEQHRKNINRKLNIRSAVDFFAFGYAFNMI